MRSALTLSIAATSIAVLFSTPAYATAEICGNGIDDDGNGLTDEGCYPTLTTGVCESPLSCGDTGMISWSTGSLHYDLPPDIAPAVPYGPGIGFRRFYTSMFSPVGVNPVSVNKVPLGAGWQHTYLTYIYQFTNLVTGKVNVVLHTSQGRDVLYVIGTPSGGWDNYSPQVGEHVMSLKQNQTSHLYQVQLLTGETLVYNSSGQITEIWDTVNPTPNKVLITWDSTTNGNVSTVTDANGRRRLLFSYTHNLMTSVQFQTKSSGGVWSTQHTTTYAYATFVNNVTRDATSNWYTPANATEWTTLLSGTGISNPSNLWLSQQSSGNLADTIGSAALAPHNAPSYQNTVAGWARKAVGTAEGAGNQGFDSTTLGNNATTSGLLLSIVEVASTPTAEREVLGFGAGNDHRYGAITTAPVYKAAGLGGAGSATGTLNPGTAVRVVVQQVDRLHSASTTYTDQGEILTPTWTNPTAGGSLLVIGDAVGASANARYLYTAFWSGASAEITQSQVTTIMSRLNGGLGVLSTVTIGGQLAQTNSYNATTGKLTQIVDGSSNNLVTVAYDSTTTSKAVRIDTPRGTVGLEYVSPRTACFGKTALYFNKGNSTTCSVDSDCGTGLMCGGKTGSGSTGVCFHAGRCMTTSTVNGESVVTNVDPFSQSPSVPCSGACTDVALYSWSTDTNWFNVTSRTDAAGLYDTVSFCTSADGVGCTPGLPKQIKYGDSPAGGPNRQEFYIYDTVYPGRIAEIDRPSDLSGSSSSCGWSIFTGCERTRYHYDTTSQQLTSIEQDGWTWDASSSSPVAYANTINYTRDGKARITEIDGAVTGIKTIYDYSDGNTDPNLDYFLSDYKAYSDATHFLKPQFTAYDFWGHPTALKAPDGNFTCDTYDTARGQLTSRRHAMAGQTSCVTTDPSDITTSWARDSALRLTSMTRPDGSCLLYSYDSNGRIFQTKRRDDCNGSSAGETQTWNYTPDSEISEIDTYDSTGTLTAKQPYTYFDSRRLQEIVNPVDTSKFTGLVYDAGGKVTEVDGAGSLSETVFNYDGLPGRDHRITSIKEYKTSTTSDTWSLLYSWIGGQSQYTDGDGKSVGSVRDDKNRLVRLTSPDFANTTRRVFDGADRLVTVIEDQESFNITSTFTFDALSRPLNSDYFGTCAVTTGTPHPEIQRAYDTLPSGVTCPAAMTGGCNNLSGRLAYVEAILMCSSTYQTTDGSLDQFTYYSYDKAGRVVEEYITDDSGRTADHLYSYTKNGALSKVTTPSGAVVGWDYGSSASNSDTDRITKLWRTSTSTPIADTITWNPFGPLKHYNWEATYAGSLQTNIYRNLAYRITMVQDAQGPGVSNGYYVSITEDAKGRVTSRQYVPSNPTLAGLYNSYFLYDEQDRVICETTDSQSSCPTTNVGNDIKNGQVGLFTAAGDWNSLNRPVPGSSGGLMNRFNPSGYGTSHQVTTLSQKDGTPVLGDTSLVYDLRGSRGYDDNMSTLTNDRRDYTYDGRRNVVNVRGQYYTGTAWHYYDVASAFDAGNRRVFKSFYDETTAKTASWYFYYDSLNRLTEVRYTPDTSAPSTYSLFQLYWLGNLMTLYWQTDYPSATTSKRYTLHDETGRIYEMWNWPSSGNAWLVWLINPTAWGDDQSINVGAGSIYQPLLFPGQYVDTETAAYENDGVTIHRPGLAVNGARSFDAFLGSYLQADPLADQTRSTYVYSDSDPVNKSDPWGLSSWIDTGPGGVYMCDDDTTTTGGVIIEGEYIPTEFETMECFDVGFGTDNNGTGVGSGYTHPHVFGPGGSGPSPKWLKWLKNIFGFSNEPEIPPTNDPVAGTWGCYDAPCVLSLTSDPTHVLFIENITVTGYDSEVLACAAATTQCATIGPTLFPYLNGNWNLDCVDYCRPTMVSSGPYQ